MAEPWGISTLLKRVEKTQTGADVVPLHKLPSLDKLGDAIRTAQNEVTTWECAQQRLQMMYEDELGKISTELTDAKRVLSMAYEAFEAAIEQRGIRGIKPVGVERDRQTEPKP